MSQAEEALDELVAMLDIPEPNCSCHTNPPCSDCLNFGGQREAISNLRSSIKALATQALPPTA